LLDALDAASSTVGEIPPSPIEDRVRVLEQECHFDPLLVVQRGSGSATGSVFATILRFDGALSVVFFGPLRGSCPAIGASPSGNDAMLMRPPN